MIALGNDQRALLRRIKSIGQQVGASSKQVKAAIETGLVESNLRNLPGGDRDSAGWRQERASIYRDPTNLDASIRRFYSETARVKDQYGSAGSLAAAVQRPAAQYRGRYQQRADEAQALLGGAGSQAQTASATRTVRGVPVTPGGEDRSQLLAQYLLNRNQPGALTSLAGELGSLKAPVTKTTIPGPVQQGAEGRPGSFQITGPNPKRLQPVLVQFARKVAGVYGKPLTGSDGTGHSRLTVNGNVSQHSTGNATDIPASGKSLIEMGRAALIAAGMPRTQAMRQTGGLFNVGSHQIIFNTHEGGDHTNHLHISAR